MVSEPGERPARMLLTRAVSFSTYRPNTVYGVPVRLQYCSISRRRLSRRLINYSVYVW